MRFARGSQRAEYLRIIVILVKDSKLLSGVEEIDYRRRFFRTDPLLYHKFINMVILGQETYIQKTPENQHYQEIIYFSSKKLEI